MYESIFTARALKDLKPIPKKEQNRILDRIADLQDDLQGDVKRLTNHTPEYRLRVGNWRVLFECTENRIIIYRIRHRREAYR